MLTIIILGIDFLTRLLTIDPAKRMTVGEFLSFFFCSVTRYTSDICFDHRVDEALQHRWLEMTTNPTTHRPALNPPVNDLQRTTPSVTSPSMSMQSSFGYSQQLGEPPSPFSWGLNSEFSKTEQNFLSLEQTI
jgi:hypothetical protein